jgi:CHASE3 domain sensor protein
MPRSTTLGSGADPLIWLGLVAAILFFVATGAVAYLNFRTLKTDSALIVHTGDTLAALDDVLSTIKDAETGQRGYLLTGDEGYLRPYSAATQETGPRLDALQRLTVDNPAQQDRLATLKQHIAAKLGELKHTVDLRQGGAAAAALAVVQAPGAPGEPGFDHHLVKPVNLERLEQLLADVSSARPRDAVGA